ncbi:ABC transporter substrate-binding protein [Frankia sp. AiPa1]|uniref:ABC transporter substrate-binding protein n=1 Tax=Frankia sp. AiPa1 TaxID=573492 RepID=UPI00202B7F32|nr:ABC transporter substrate-binding protein [Frankia sp. AiPa1]MCL9762611.1 ABC transporter substrate-binding protein [Frankia sp. AiPa1]
MTRNEIRLGLLMPDSGVLAAGFQAARAGVDARIGAVNAAGGINGRKIVYSWRDDAGTAQGNLIGAHDLVDQQGVFGMLEFTPVASGGAAYLAEQGVPVVGLATEQVWTTNRNMFAVMNAAGTAVDTYGRAVAARGGGAAYLVRAGISAPVSGTADRVAQSLQAAGVRVVGNSPYLAGADSVTELARRIVDSGADAVVTMLAAPAMPALLAAIEAAGGEPDVVLAIGAYDRGLLRPGDPSLAGMLVPVSYRPFEVGGPPTVRYLDAMHRYAPQLADPDQESPLVSYIDADLFLRGLRAAGPCPTRGAFLAAMRGLTGYDADGLLGPTNVALAQAHPGACFGLLRVNAAGTAFDPDETNLCGRELTPGV